MIEDCSRYVLISSQRYIIREIYCQVNTEYQFNNDDRGSLKWQWDIKVFYTRDTEAFKYCRDENKGGEKGVLQLWDECLTTKRRLYRV